MVSKYVKYDENTNICDNNKPFKKKKKNKKIQYKKN